MFRFYYLIDLGIIFFALALLFQLITLPVEFNASDRAIKTLESSGLLYGEEITGAKKVLKAAALTYVAALVSSEGLFEADAPGQDGTPGEVILALSGDVEGETTAFYIYRQISQYGVKVSSLARGLGFGDNLEYADELTLGRSIVNRQIFKP